MMQTGIDFFDTQKPKPGDLWIVASGPGMGRSTLLRNLVVGIADHLEEGRIAYWDLERTYAGWKDAILKMRPTVPGLLDYRNSSPWQDKMELVEALNQSTDDTIQTVAIDSFDLFTDNLDTGLKMLKLWLVRTGRFGIVSVSLPRTCWRQTADWDTVKPSTLPEPLLNNGTAVFWVSKTSQKSIKEGGADTLRVVLAKTLAGLGDASHNHAFIWEPETGRIL